MSMLTPAGMGGKYRVTGRGYLPPPRRRGPRIALLAALSLAVLAGGGTVWHLVLGQDLLWLRAPRHKAAACVSGQRSSHAPAAAGRSGGIGGAAAPDSATVPLAPRQVTVNVYNATTRPGLAAKVAAELRVRGFAVSQVANDPTHAKIPGPAEVRGGPAGAAQLRLIMAQVANARQADDSRRDASVDLVLGDTFQALRDQAQANAALVPATPSPVPGGRNHC